MLTLIIQSQGKNLYKAVLEGKVLAESTTTPFFDAARTLLNDGFTPDTPLSMIHEGSSIVSMRSTVGKAAGRAVSETAKHGPRFQKYREFEAKGVFPGVPVSQGEGLQG